MSRSARFVLVIVALAGSGSASAQEFQLSYTTLDFYFLYQETEAQGIQTDVDINQTASINIKDGPGVGVRGSVQLPARFFLIGELSATIISLEGRITNPMADVTIDDDFNFRQARLGAGYALPISDVVHLNFGLTYDNTNYDIGGIATADFATNRQGLGARVGVRAKVGRRWELHGQVRYTDVGKVDLDTRTLDPDTLFGAQVLYYVASTFALGATVEFGEINSASLTLRFAFGKTRVGR